MLGIPARRSIDEASVNKYNKSSTISRRWQTPAPPSILHLPRPPRRTRKPKKCNPCVDKGGDRGEAEAEEEAHRGKLEALFGQEREFARSVPIVLLHPNALHSPRRGKVLSRHSASSRDSEDARLILELESSEREQARGREAWGPQDWKFQAEVLRAECNLLRMEKEVAVRRWEQGCAEMHHALTMAHSLHSAVQTIITGRKKIVDEKNAQVVLQTTLQNQIEALQGKLEKLQKNSEFRESELKKCSNFDRQAMFLQRRLDKLRKRSKERSYSEDTAKALQQRLETLVRAVCTTAQWEIDKENTKADYVEIALEEEDEHEVLIEPRLRIQRPSSIKCCLDDNQNRLLDATLLKEKLDSLSMNMNERKEAAAQIQKEYRSMLSSSGNCSSRRVDAPERAEQEGNQENKLCSERCKATIRKIAEQVQAETEQWFQVQEILHHVREEMEDLQKSRDFWEDHALHSDAKIATLQTAMHEWREKAHKYENKISELQSEITRVRNEKEQVRHRHALEQSRWLDGSSRLTHGLVLSNSAKSSMTSATDCDSDNHEAAINVSHRGNSSESREIEVVHHTEDENWNEKENLKTKFVHIAKPRIPKAMQKSHTSSNKNSLNTASKLRQSDTNQKSFTMHPQQSDCVAGQLSGKRSNRKVRDLHSKENSLLLNRHPQRGTPVKRGQVNKNLEVMGSGKSSSSSTRSPLVDIGNASPFRIRRTIFPVSTEESSDP
ncbi:hypothetical protein SUGI_0404110 [Cryptomeria japonica]|uniref:uncharacterized protein LOC131077366 n=1 Tax=Cryptomeria japonica TaxID=3369 RepID=UPI002408E910|nr:uncharacterized protein LOC131077366 [Cryptomeria japonica]GLJ21689.1 hypothetical protein SUGI_0404110 [Cryptomeria japonica]